MELSKSRQQFFFHSPQIIVPSENWVARSFGDVSFGNEDDELPFRFNVVEEYESCEYFFETLDYILESYDLIAEGVAINNEDYFVGGSSMLRWFFTIVYFLVFFFLLDLVFRNTMGISPITNVLQLACLIVAFIVSVGLADYTIKKIEEKYSKK